jgi:ribosomal protein L44E
MTKCSWCDTETLETYTLKDNKSLCFKCATKHYEQIQNKINLHIKEIQEMKDELGNYANNLLELKRQICEHKNLFDTGYGKWTDKMRFIYRCKDCGKEILKEG